MMSARRNPTMFNRQCRAKVCNTGNRRATKAVALVSPITKRRTWQDVAAPAGIQPDRTRRQPLTHRLASQDTATAEPMTDRNPRSDSPRTSPTDFGRHESNARVDRYENKKRMPSNNAPHLTETHRQSVDRTGSSGPSSTRNLIRGPARTDRC